MASKAWLGELIGRDIKSVRRLLGDHPEVSVPGGYSVPAAIAAMIAEAVEGFGTGSDSPALERYRAARASIAEAEAAAIAGETIRLSDLRAWWSGVAATIRRAVEALEARWGIEETSPGAVMRGAIEGADREARRRMKQAERREARR